jgi:hypothetical protein
VLATHFLTLPCLIGYPCFGFDQLLAYVSYNTCLYSWNICSTFELESNSNICFINDYLSTFIQYSFIHCHMSMIVWGWRRSFSIPTYWLFLRKKGIVWMWVKISLERRSCVMIVSSIIIIITFLFSRLIRQIHPPSCLTSLLFPWHLYYQLLGGGTLWSKEGLEGNLEYESLTAK